MGWRIGDLALPGHRFADALMQEFTKGSAMNAVKAVTLVVLFSLFTCSPALAGVQLSIRDGRVSLVARDATVREILTEWARIGHTQIVNLEKIPGGPVTIQLENVTEDEALAVLLRRVSGYIVAARAVAVANASRFDRIIVLPTSTAPPEPPPANASARPASQGPAGPHQQPESFQPQQVAAGANDVAGEQALPIMVVGEPSAPETASMSQTSRQPLETMDPRQFRIPPPQVAPPVSTPTGAGLASVGTTRPGIIVQPPPQSGVAGQR